MSGKRESTILFAGKSDGYTWYDLPTFSPRAALADDPGTVGKGSFSKNYLALPHAGVGASGSSVYERATYARISLPAGSTTGKAASINPTETELALIYLTGANRLFHHPMPGLSSTAYATQPSGNGWDAAYSPNGQYLAACSASAPNRLTVYDAATKLPVSISGTQPATTASSVAWSPDSRYLAVTMQTTGAAPMLRVYDAAAGFSDVVAYSTSPVAQAHCSSFSPDGTLLALAHSNIGSGVFQRGMTLISTASWGISGSSFVQGRFFNGRGVAFSRGGKYLALGGDAVTNRIEVYDAASSFSSVVSLTAGGAGVAVNHVWFD